MKRPTLWIALAILLAIPVALYSYVNGLRSESISRETALNAQYLANQNRLSTYISGFYEQLGVADRKVGKLEDILVEAVKGRYDKDGFSANGAFFAAIAEAYPQVGDVNVYDKVVDYVAGQREGYRAVQDKLLDMLRGYDNWRQDGFVQSWVVESWLDVPSKRLEARIGKNVTHGGGARDQMYLIVLTEDARGAYESGAMAPLSMPAPTNR